MDTKRPTSLPVPESRQRSLGELKQLLGFSHPSEVTVTEAQPSEANEALDVQPATKQSLTLKEKATATCARTGVRLDVSPSEADILKAAGATTGFA
jgi:hypothetical protein